MFISSYYVNIYKKQKQKKIKNNYEKYDKKMYDY